jgi:hypothetical protein
VEGECDQSWLRDQEITADLHEAALREVLAQERAATAAGDLPPEDAADASTEACEAPPEAAADQGAEEVAAAAAAAADVAPPPEDVDAPPGDAAEPLPLPGTWRRRHTRGGGNCLFHALRRALDVDMSHLDLRAAVVAWATAHGHLEWRDLAFAGHMDDIGDVEGARRGLVDRSYAVVMNLEGTYGGMFEAHVAGLAFDREVCVWSALAGAWVCVGRAGQTRAFLHHSAHPAEHWESVDLLP